jgi:hypothetical protein
MWGYSLLASKASGIAETARTIEFKVMAATTKATAAMAVQEMERRNKINLIIFVFRIYDTKKRLEGFLLITSFGVYQYNV